jgi:hypothetical protein
MVETKVPSRALDLCIDLCQRVAKMILVGLVSFILIPGNLFFGCHVFNCEGLSCSVFRFRECRRPFQR